MVIIFIATGLGVMIGFVMCWLVTAEQVADHPQELAEAYWEGFRAGQMRPGEEKP